VQAGRAGLATAKKALTATAKEALKSAAKTGGLKKLAAKFASDTFEGHMISVTKKIVTSTMKSKGFRDAMTDTVRDNAKFALLETYIKVQADRYRIAMDQRTKVNYKTPDKLLLDLDVTGFGSAIKSAACEEDANKVAGKFLEAFGFFDPTGILGALANFVKHPGCEHAVGEMKKKTESLDLDWNGWIAEGFSEGCGGKAGETGGAGRTKQSKR